MNPKKILTVVIVAILIAVFFGFDLSQYLDVKDLQQRVDQQPLLTGALFFALYVLMVSLNIPGAAVLTIGAGAIFGLWWGLFMVSFASSIGATIAMLIARTLLRDSVENRFKRLVKKVNEGIEERGMMYLLSLRLIPVVPFFAINLVFGLTRIRALNFYIISQIGMLPGSFIYVNAGAQLGQVESLTLWSLLTPGVVISILLLLMFPFIIKTITHAVQQYRLKRTFTKPKKFDANLIVIGAGAAGLVSSYIAAAVKAKVFLIERHKMGGDCLNTGCVPSKALIRSAKVAHEARKASSFGVHVSEPSINFSEVMQRVDKVVAEVEPHDSVERYTKLGVDCIAGEAEILSPYEVRVDGKVLAAKKMIIATGASPAIPPIKGLDSVAYLTSDTLWTLKEQPKHLVIVGGGPIGCELAQAFNRLGTKVSIFERGDRLLSFAEPEVSELLKTTLEDEGIQLFLSSEIDSFSEKNIADNVERKITFKPQDAKNEGDPLQEFVFDQVLICTGRAANTAGFGLDKLGLGKNKNGTLKVDEYLRTKFDNILACGDVVGPYQFTHAASHQAWYACVNALFGRFKKFKVSYDVIPWVIFTDPQIAHVGKTDEQLKEEDIAFDITTYDMEELDRAIADSSKEGFVRVLSLKGKDKILGVTIVSSNAGDMITEFVSAMKFNKGLNSILGTIHSYPTFAEANKGAAGQWKNANKPEFLLSLVEKFHKFTL